MKPILGLLTLCGGILAGRSRTEKNIGTGAATGAVTGWLFGATADSALLGTIIGACAIASLVFVAQTHVSWQKSKERR